MALLGGTVETPQELYVHKLGAALKMENTILEMLPQLEEHANDSQLKQSLRQHYDETQRHVENLERAFQALGAEVDDSPSPAIEGLEKEGQANLKMVDDRLNDDVIIGGVCETEHHEIAVYEGLITKAEAMGEQDVVALLQENLENEAATLKEAQQMGRQLAQRTAQARLRRRGRSCGGPEAGPHRANVVRPHDACARSTSPGQKTNSAHGRAFFAQFFVW